MNVATISRSHRLVLASRGRPQSRRGPVQRPLTPRAEGSSGERAAGITLYTAPTWNGWKAAIALEELGLSYRVKRLDLSKGEQKQEWFTGINPNGKIPALVDHDAGDLAVWESGAVLAYLAEQKDPDRRLLPAEPAQRYEVLSWVCFQVAGLGPAQGQAALWLLFEPQRDELALKRYIEETERLYGVMETRLAYRQWLAAERYTIADIACAPCVLMHDLLGIPLKERFPALRAWLDRFKGREAVQRGLNVPDRNLILDHTPQWEGFLATARERLESMRPIVPEE